MDARDGILKPCDVLQIPVYATYRSARGIVATKAMFYRTDYIVLRYVDGSGYNKDILVIRPTVFEMGKNYWDTDERKWMVT